MIELYIINKSPRFPIGQKCMKEGYGYAQARTLASPGRDRIYLAEKLNSDRNRNELGIGTAQASPADNDRIFSPKNDSKYPLLVQIKP